MDASSLERDDGERSMPHVVSKEARMYGGDRLTED
jgi:hypothetical protein